MVVVVVIIIIIIIIVGLVQHDSSSLFISAKAANSRS